MAAGQIPSGISEEGTPSSTPSQQEIKHNGFEPPRGFKTSIEQAETKDVKAQSNQPSQPTEEKKVEAQKESGPTGPVPFKIKGKEYSEDDLAKYIESGLRLDDYTRKTQEVAELRKKTQQEYEDFIKYVQQDPEGFLNQLKGQATQEAAQAQSSPDLDRLVEQKIQQKYGHQFETLQQLQQERLQAKLDSELAEAKKEFPLVDEDDILAYKYIYADRSAKDIAQSLAAKQQRILDQYLSQKAKDTQTTEKGSNVTAQEPPQAQSGYKTPLDKKGRFSFDALEKMAFGRNY